MSKTIKAYQVTDGDEGWAIIFATNNATARREGANQINCEWQDIDSCRRMPEVDQYAPGPVPASVLIENGWWFECRHCSRKVDADLFNNVVEEGMRADDFAIIDTPDGGVFCCQACVDADAKYHADRKAALADLKAQAIAKFPGCEVHHVHIYADKIIARDERGYSQSEVQFSFPNGKQHVRWHWGEETVSVAQSDEEAWHEYRSKTQEVAQ